MTDDEVLPSDLFIKKLPEITLRSNRWIVHCSGCKKRFERGFFIMGSSEWVIPTALKGCGWQLTKKEGKVRILCPKCKGASDGTA